MSRKVQVELERIDEKTLNLIKKGVIQEISSAFEVDESPIESTNSLVKEEIDLAVDELYYIRASDDSDIELDSTGKPVSTSVNEPKENSDTDEAEESRLNIQGDFLALNLPKRIRLQCRSCGRSCALASSRTCTTCSQTMLFSCRACDKDFLTIEECVKHQEAGCHLLAIYNCHQCKFFTNSATEYRRHERLSHTFIKCVRCQRDIKRGVIYRHRQTCGKPPKFKCAHCPYVHHFGYMMRDHVTRMHAKESGSYVPTTEERRCVDCKKLCRTLAELRRHRDIGCRVPLLPKPINRFTCHVCAYASFTWASLVTHIKETHAHAYPASMYPRCERCYRTLMTPQELQNHDRIQCRRPVSSLSCAHCGTMCSSRTEMGKHLNTRHPHLFPEFKKQMKA